MVRNLTAIGLLTAAALGTTASGRPDCPPNANPHAYVGRVECMSAEAQADIARMFREAPDYEAAAPGCAKACSITCAAGGSCSTSCPDGKEASCFCDITTDQPWCTCRGCGR